MHLVSIVQALSLWLLFIASPVHSLEMIALKSSIRQEIKNRLQHVTRESILSQSHGVLEQLFSVPHVQDSRTVCIYLSMQGEVDTFPIIDRCLQMGKTVFIPKVIGKHPEDMRMFHLKSFDQIETFPKNKWGIPEPSLSMINIEEEPYLETIDVVFLPGVAFDSVGGRVGHGKGYYGKKIAALLFIFSSLHSLF